MDDLNIEVADIRTFEGHDGIGFNATIYINGDKIGKGIELADGADLTIRPFGKVVKDDSGEYISNDLLKYNRKVLKEAREKARSLPERKLPSGIAITPNLGLLVCEAVNEKLASK